MPLTDDDALLERVAVYKALGDPTRLQLALIIRDAHPEPICACNFPEEFGMSQPTISHHLSKLLKAGIITREQRGRWAYFGLNPEFDSNLLGEDVSTLPKVSGNRCVNVE